MVSGVTVYVIAPDEEFEYIERPTSRIAEFSNKVANRVANKVTLYPFLVSKVFMSPKRCAI